MFVVPMVVLVGSTLYFDKDFLVGIYITLGTTAIYILATRMMNMHDTFDTMIDGFKTMVEPLGVLVAAFILKDVNDALGLAEYVVSSMQPLLTPESLPAVIFASMALISFMTGSNWGVFVIVLPIVTALANNLGADMILVLDQGRIVEQAHRSKTHSAHEQLLEREGLYASLYYTQFRDTKACNPSPRHRR